MKTFNVRPKITPKVFSKTKINSDRKSLKYGFHTTEIIVDSEVPKPIWNLAFDSVIREINMSRSVNPYEKYKLTLDNKAIWELEKNDEKQIDAPPPMMVIYYAICHILDVLYANDPIARFMFLETLARQPYFSYVSLYHLYETIGLWSIATNCKILHLQQENNECAHLKIMEELGGSRKWKDRFLSRHAALAYYTVLLVFFMVSPRLAYLSSQLLENHAKHTYSQFIVENSEILKTMPLTESVDGYIPVLTNSCDMKTLYDVFCNIMEDEVTHSETMEFLICDSGDECNV